MADEDKTTKAAATGPPTGIGSADVRHAPFRKKWIGGGFVVIGLLAGVIVYLARPTLYESEAKLLVRYVVDTKSVETGAGAQVQQPTYNGVDIINAELEILTSLDLCKDVAHLITAERILGKKGGSDETEAAFAVYKGLTVENPRNSSVIKVRFAHSDPALCQAVLEKIVESCLELHRAIHRTAGSYYDVFREQKNYLLIRIRQSEESLRKLKEEANVNAGTVDEARKNLSDRLSRLLEELDDAEVQVAVNGTSLA